MSQLPVFIRVSPAQHEDLAAWNDELLWHLQTTNDIVKFIRNTILKAEPVVKSGLVLFRDLDDNSFQVINFRGKNILQPVPADGVVKLKRETKKGLTFEEKIELLKRFVLETGHAPEPKEVFENCRLGTFYNSLKKQKQKYEDYITEIGSPAENESHGEVVGTGEDGGVLIDDGGRGRLPRRGGLPVTEEDEEESASVEEVVEPTPAAPVEDVEQKPVRRSASKRSSAK